MKMSPRVAAAVVVAVLVVPGVAYAATSHDDAGATANIDSAIASLELAKAQISAPVPTVTVTETAEPTATPTVTVTATPSPTQPAPPTPTPTPTPPSPPSSARALLGMSAPASSWSQRVSEVGPGLQARRIFVSSLTGSLSLATTACNAGMTPVLSFKEGTYSWAQIGNGAADTDLRALATKLAALPCASFVTIHHEPSNDGNATDYTNMAAHAYPILGGAQGGKVQVGPIGNGWWFNSNQQGYTDAELAQWVGPRVLAVSDFVAADTYQGQADAEDVASKVKRMSAWAHRTPGVRALGLGEFNDQTASGMADALATIKADPLFVFACVWNMDGTGSANAHVLTGDSLAVFRDALANW